MDIKDKSFLDSLSKEVRDSLESEEWQQRKENWSKILNERSHRENSITMSELCEDRNELLLLIKYFTPHEYLGQELVSRILDIQKNWKPIYPEVQQDALNHYLSEYNMLLEILGYFGPYSYLPQKIATRVVDVQTTWKPIHFIF